MRALGTAELDQVTGGANVTDADVRCAAAQEDLQRFLVLPPGARRGHLADSPESRAASRSVLSECFQSPIVLGLIDANRHAVEVPRTGR